jgi:hypothetical protein
LLCHHINHHFHLVYTLELKMSVLHSLHSLFLNLSCYF